MKNRNEGALAKNRKDNSDSKKPTWRDVKAILAGRGQAELLRLVADLYALNAGNKSFIHSRYALGAQPLESYRSIISDALYPDVDRNKPIRVC
uniref:Uncharacterized protein n=1 Tax=Candidatus Kentrum eta TaxID=2126337 RepID=A0A450UM36_9GAMM|nr:MAG: hypothetical protein BECKH772A_GA0070896_1005811 [Candidatus Kentron sp. H]VFJ94200.1 MAG: hypothetical protein BECKH772B_GA0070898_1005711 [Candidatus Kentron sp. H]VFK00878.1 MAG: hypothetical protein BECKH772C_GA0070978_1005411 [Candidatus Kentron sp. H]